ncbi:hypothetical protein LWM68_40860 [Niabella sp. W65]|nr:hypothetical protein [Niabella sp. W65]MCH7368524.1 hypothetical protein [Niabella sp. W65]ULT44116.1 hypothetical protein KRR40_12570 [Niabella sp. I65]
MKSKYSLILLALQARLAPVLKYIELDLNQLEIYETRPAVAFPCGLIRFTGQYRPMQLKMQWNNFTLSIKLGFDTFGNTSSLVPQVSREKALQYLEVEQQVYLLLQGGMLTGF